MKAIGFYIFWLLFRPFLWMPLRVWYGLSDALYFIMSRVVKYRKHVIVPNLKRSFPEKDDAWIEETTQKIYRHLGDYFIESLKLDAFSAKTLKKRCKFNNLEIIDEAKTNGKDVIAFLGHYGNWEWITSLPLWVDLNCLTVYRPLKNKYFDNYFMKIRRRFGVTPIPMNHSAREIIRLSKTETRNISGLIADQNPGHYEMRYWVNFLNRDTAVFEGGEKIARKINATVVFLKMRKVRRGYYETDIIPMFDNAADTKPYDITKTYFRLLEDSIKERPELWLWSHKRWKREKPEGLKTHELRTE